MGLQLSGSVQLDGNLLVTGSTNSVFENILVSGKITSQEIETQFVSSSIIYSSGSNKFGDDITDNHQFTGSVDVSGNSTFNGIQTIDIGSVTNDTYSKVIKWGDSVGINKALLGFFSNTGVDYRGFIGADNNGTLYLGDNGGGGIKVKTGGPSGTTLMNITSGKTEITGSVDVSGSINIISHGANGVVLNQDASNADISSRLLFMNNLPSGMAIMYESGRMSFRSGSIPNATSGTEVMSIQHNNLNLSSGNLVVASGQGIDFSATSNGSGTTTSELLNDYEEGTWTPSLTFNGGSSGMTYTVQSGKYTKVGRTVNVNCYIVLTNKGSDTGNAQIENLPFSIPNNNGNYSAISFYNDGNVTYGGTLQGFCNINGTSIVLGQVSEAGSITLLTNSNFANNSAFMISLTYFTS
jgi:hypothetical protein